MIIFLYWPNLIPPFHFRALFFNVGNLIDKMLHWHNIYIQRRANELGCLLLETSSILTVIKSLLLRRSMHCYVSSFFQLSLVTFTFLRPWVIGDFSFWFWKSYWDLHWASSSGCEYEIPLHSARYSNCYSILPGYHSDTWPQSAWRWWLFHHLCTCSGSRILYHGVSVNSNEMKTFYILERSEVFGLPRSQNTQKWREHLVSLARNSREARNNVDMSDREWNKQWDMLMKPGVYEVTVADMLLPALSHALGRDILIFNTFKASRSISGRKGHFCSVSRTVGVERLRRNHHFLLPTTESIMNNWNLKQNEMSFSPRSWWKIWKTVPTLAGL